MKKSLPIILITLLVAAAAAVLGVALARKDTSASDGTDGGGTGGGTGGGGSSSGGGTSASSGGFPLVQGSRGDLVRELQTRLNDQLGLIGEPLIDVDGIFGPRTAEAARYLLGTDTVTRELYDQLLVA